MIIVPARRSLTLSDSQLNRSFSISTLLILTAAAGAGVAYWIDRPKDDPGWNDHVLPYQMSTAPDSFADKGRTPPRLGAMTNGEDLRGIKYENGLQLYSHGHANGWIVAMIEFIEMARYIRFPHEKVFDLTDKEWTYDHFEYARQLGHLDGQSGINRLLKKHSENELRKILSQPPPDRRLRRWLFLGMSVSLFIVAISRVVMQKRTTVE